MIATLSLVSRLFVETDPDITPEHVFGAPTDVLVAFLSFGFSARYGAQHDLTKLSLLLRGEYEVDLAPLLTFADRNVEVEADQRELDRVWQNAAPLAATIDAVVSVLERHEEEVDALVAGTPDLLPLLRDLGVIARSAADRGARIRLTFEL